MRCAYHMGAPLALVLGSQLEKSALSDAIPFAQQMGHVHMHV